MLSRAGTYTWPISFAIPATSPPTLHCDFGHVVWKLKAYAHRPGTFTTKMSASQDITVVACPSEDDLEEYIELDREALKLRSHGHENRHRSLNNLGADLYDMHLLRPSLNGINESIQLLREALVICPLDRNDRIMSLDNLIRSLQSHYDLTVPKADI